MIDYSRKRKSLVSTVVPNLDNKLNLVLLGDSFTWGDGANFDDIAPQLLGNKWYNDARVIAFNYFRFPNEGTMAEQFGEIQQQYLTALRENPQNAHVKPTNTWSSSLDVTVHNLGMPGNSTAGMTISLVDWLHKNKKLCKTRPVCVLANYNILNRFHIVSRFQQDGTFDPISITDNPPVLKKYSRGHNAHDDWTVNYLDMYDQLKGWEFDLCYNIFLAQEMCEKYNVSFCFSGPGRDTKISQKQHWHDVNYMNFPINWDRDVFDVIPSLGNIVDYHNILNKDIMENPLSACGHFNKAGQKRVANHFNKKLLANVDWFWNT